MAGPRHRRAPQSRTVEPPSEALSPWVLLRSVTFHPFVFRRMIRAADPAAQAGDIVQVYDKNGDLFGRAFYNPRSEITLRMITWGPRAVDDDFWIERLQSAVALRDTLRLADVTDAYRLVHAEGDDLGGLVVERYGDCLVAELFALGMQRRASWFLNRLAGVLGPPTRLDRPQQAAAAWQIVLRADDRAAELEGFRIAAAPPLKTTVQEHGVRYHVDLTGGHKTGFFCDQRDNRRQFAAWCRDATVLDCCCYTGGFGLCARVLGGAGEVTSVDLDEQALELARANAHLNQVRIQHVHGDAFQYLRQMRLNSRCYDAVVLDPPKFAPTRRDVDDAIHKYGDLNTLACQVVRPGGLLLTCSCSGAVPPHVFLDTVRRSAQRAGRRLQQLGASGAAADHPVADNCPETAYLKALWFRVL